jgi:hypothetical protein
MSIDPPLYVIALKGHFDVTFSRSELRRALERQLDRISRITIA